jgi:RNA polymerase sigma-70 factor (ECF subfamily)
MGEHDVANESTLLERARSYDREALGDLYDQYSPLIYSYLYRRTSDRQVAEDLTSEAFIRVLRALQQGQFFHTSFRSWLYRIAHNLVVDYYRRRPSAPDAVFDERLVAAEDDLDSVMTDRLSRQDLQTAISRLTPNQQEVLALRFGEQLATKEVAEIMEKSVGAIEALQHRALAALRRMLLETKE